MRADGTRVVNDAGGSYRIDENGDASRISDGFTLATSESFALHRECDENLDCGFAVSDLDDGSSGPVGIDGRFQSFDDVSLSPDGGAVSFIERSSRSIRLLTDLDSGRTVEGVQTRDGGSGWASDSSGEFVLEQGGGLTFVQRGTGTIEQIELDIGPRFALTSIDVRHVATIADGS